MLLFDWWLFGIVAVWLFSGVCCFVGKCLPACLGLLWLQVFDRWLLWYWWCWLFDLGLWLVCLLFILVGVWVLFGVFDLLLGDLVVC